MRYLAHLTKEMQKLNGYEFPEYIIVPSIVDAQEGFWINNDYEFTRIEKDCIEFIMPSQIMFVEKQ